MLQILIPMAGQGSRFREAGYAMPKPFIPIRDRPMVAWVIENLKPKQAHRFVFLVWHEDLKLFPVEACLRELCPDGEIVIVKERTEGAACTALLAKEKLNPNDELLIANSDQWIEEDINRFLEKAQREKWDGLIMTMPSNDPKWSYAQVNENGLVTQTAEKEVISPHATVGIYYFQRAAFFFEAAEAMIHRGLKSRGEYYVCPAFNLMIEADLAIGIHDIGSAMHGLGTPEDLQSFVSQAAEKLGH